jgi:glyoxylase-like metal-dependent hydrolase (beta-lactamase superfamily II)
MQYNHYQRETYELLVLYHIGALENSIHFVFDLSSKQCAIIDPAWEAELFLDIITKKGYTLSEIWLTHWHPDHVNATDDLASQTGATVKIGEHELDYLQITSPVTLLKDEECWKFGNTAVQVIHTPGHSKGGICYQLSDDIFMGDTLFVYGAGHCSLPGGSVDDFYHTMQKIKTQVNDNVYLRCGHDYGETQTTTMLEQKQYNAYLLLDNENDFHTYIEKMSKGLVAYPTSRANKQQLLATI